jgi:hypothetical protein
LLFVAACVACAPLLAAEPQPLPSQYENLKAFDKLIGTWVYDGPVLEDGPLAKKGERVKVAIHYRWILNKSVVEIEFMAWLEDGREVGGKRLVGWHPAEKHMVGGGWDSLGTLWLGAETVSEDGKTFIAEDKGFSPDGREVTQQSITTVEGDTLTLQWKNRKGPDFTGDSPKYVFKRQKK